MWQSLFPKKKKFLINSQAYFMRIFPSTKDHSQNGINRNNFKCPDKLQNKKCKIAFQYVELMKYLFIRENVLTRRTLWPVLHR